MREELFVIAHILSLASNSNEPAALGDGFIEQFKVVAGVGFGQERTKIMLQKVV
jgi:hypothetical protein